MALEEIEILMQTKLDRGGRNTRSTSQNPLYSIYIYANKVATMETHRSSAKFISMNLPVQICRKIWS